MAGAMPNRVTDERKEPSQSPEAWRPIYTAVVVTLVVMLIGLGVFSSYFSS